MIVVGVVAIILFAAAVWAVMYPSCCARRLGLCAAGGPIELAAAVDDPLPLNAAELEPSAAAEMVGATAPVNDAGLRPGTTLLDKSGVEVQAAAGGSGLAPVGAAMAPFDDAPPAWTSGASELSASGSVAGALFPGGAQTQSARMSGYAGAIARGHMGRQTHRGGTLSRQIGNNADIRSQWAGHVGDQAGIQINAGPVASATGARVELPSNSPQMAGSVEGATIAAETERTQATNPIMTMRQPI